MMKSTNIFSLAGIVAASAIGLSGCKLSELTDSEDDGSTVVLQGRAAIGAPMAGATIDIKGADGREFRVYADASGYFAIESEPEDARLRALFRGNDLVAPVVIRATFNESTYHSVLCNVVYGEFDSVNVHPLTDYVMNETAAVSTAYDMWTSGASDNYCNSTFVENFRDTASTLETTFNFFNSAFDADGTGFDALLDNFNPETFAAAPAAVDFRILNGLGSMVLIPGTAWTGTAVGTFNGEPVDENFVTNVPVNAEGLQELIDNLLEQHSAEDVFIESLSVTLEGDGVGELGTTVSATLKGKAAYEGLDFVTANFNISVEMTRTASLEP